MFEKPSMDDCLWMITYAVS